MKLLSFLPAFAVLGLSGCVTGYGYSDDGYYYGRPTADAGVYGSVGYGSGYRSPGYYGYYDPYSGYYYDPYYGYYLPRPPVVIIQRPPGNGHGHHDHDHDHDQNDDHDGDDGHRPPPWRDLGDGDDDKPRPILSREPRPNEVLPVPDPRRAPRVADGDPPRFSPPAGRDSGGGMTRPQPPVRMPEPSTPPPRMRMPEPPAPAPRVRDDSTSTRER